MPLEELTRSLEQALNGGPAVVVGRQTDPAARAALPPGTALAAPTSGSTGRPKLVALGAQAVRASAAASAHRLGGAGHWLLTLPTDHIAGVNVVVRAVLAGAGLTAMGPGSFSAESFAAAAAALPAGPCYTSLVPTQLRRLAGAEPDGIGGLTRFAAVLVGGAALEPGLRRRAEAAGAVIVQTYGAAETCGGCVYDGEPLDGVEVAVAANGRIELAGPMLALGYVPGRTDAPGGVGSSGAPTGAAYPGGAAGFFERHGRRWFASSDLGVWTADGRLAVLGRSDHAITSGGHTVSPERVEEVLRGLPGVQDALVVGLAEPAWGEEVTALVVPDAARPPSLRQLRQAVKRELGPAHAPRRAALVAALPTASVGKPDRRGGAALAAQLEALGRLERLG
ncbi:MAG: AMP-binding protein [Bifidobacteriaceae bacterium]|jgi:O-succinylbenzoic acid--CoA ligase|nr:AMP-binding protein [Bifidobacteriaceae bacterium]